MERKITIITEDGSSRTVTFDSTAETLAELKNLKSSYKGKSSDFYERTSDGNLSGYFRKHFG